MAQKNSNQGGVVRAFMATLLAAFVPLLSLPGCSSDENLGSVSEGIVCPKCQPATDCASYKCNLTTGNCEAIQLLPDNSACNAGEGVCTTLVSRGVTDYVCCTGCAEQLTKTTWACHAGTQISFCGVGGKKCADCDGGNSCESYSCEKGACGKPQVLEDKTACPNGACWAGSCCTGCIDKNNACQPGTALTQCGKSAGGLVDCKSCTDGEPTCTTDACAADGSCTNLAVTNNTPCADGNQCDGSESCQGGKCTDQAGFTCPADGNVCHAPSCDANMKCAQTLLTGTDCSDANLCNGAEKCNNGVCGAGTPKNCDDKNPCTTDDCDPKTGACINTPVSGGELCENGDVCDGIGVCNDGGKCVVQPPQACDNSDPCKVFACDKVKGCVVSSFTTASCNDGDPCTTVDKCNGAGACVGSSPLKCDDGNPCTTDSCVKGQGCTAVAGNENGACDDGNDCSTGDKCVAGKCKSSGGKTCPDDTNPCTTASCDASSVCGQTNDNTAKCQVDKCHTFTTCNNGNCPAGDPIDCADTNPCTKDACDPAVGCTHEADDSATCTDADLCTESTSCKNGKCVAVPVVCEAVDDCHKVGSCNDKSGFCDAPRADVGTACDDNSGKCDDKGKCVPNPTTGEGGAGGEANTGEAGAATGGTTAGTGGKGTTPGVGGEGDVPTVGGDTGTDPSGGKAGSKATAGTTGTTTEGGANDEEVQPFVRTPGGCSCTVPQSQPSNLAWLGGLALVGALARRRRARSAHVANNRGVS